MILLYLEFFISCYVSIFNNKGDNNDFYVKQVWHEENMEGFEPAEGIF